MSIVCSWRFCPSVIAYQREKTTWEGIPEWQIEWTVQSQTESWSFKVKYGLEETVKNGGWWYREIQRDIGIYREIQGEHRLSRWSRAKNSGSCGMKSSTAVTRVTGRNSPNCVEFAGNCTRALRFLLYLPSVPASWSHILSYLILGCVFWHNKCTSFGIVHLQDAHALCGVNECTRARGALLCSNLSNRVCQANSHKAVPPPPRGWVRT